MDIAHIYIMIALIVICFDGILICGIKDKKRKPELAEEGAVEESIFRKEMKVLKATF